METVICITFIVFVIARVLLGKDNDEPTPRLRHFVQEDDEDDEKSPPLSY